MDAYDPNRAPNPQAWRALDEGERLLLVQEYHEAAGEALHDEQRDRVHALFHTIVEDQLIGGDPPEVRRALTRLRKQGLDRHEALHAIGSVLAGQIWEVSQDEAPADLGREYVLAVKKLSAEAWLAEAEEEDE